MIQYGLLLSSLLSTLSFGCRFYRLVIRWLSIRSGLVLFCRVCLWLLVGLCSLLLLAFCLCSIRCWFFLGGSRVWLPVISVWSGSLRDSWICSWCYVIFLVSLAVIIVHLLLLLHRCELLLLIQTFGSDSLLSHHLKVILHGM